jgi:hypothetical protein
VQALRFVIILLHQHQTPEKMKATIIITAAILTLQASVLFASANNTVVPGTRENSAITLSSFAPVTPDEATFEESAFLTEVTILSPVIPAEATFEDVPAVLFSATDLAPVIPAEADFE